MTDFTAEPSDPSGAGVFDFLSTWASNPWDFAATTVETIGDTVSSLGSSAGDTVSSLGSSGFEAVPDITLDLDTADVPDPTDLNLWPIAIGGLGLIAVAYMFTK